MDNQKPYANGEDGNVFPTIQPWPQPVDGEALLNDLRNFINRHVVSDDYTAVATTLWIAFTWFIDSVTIAPIANITAPMPNCGKSTLLDLMELLVKRPIKADSITPAVVFRSVDRWHPTLLIDEVDTFIKGNDDLRCILNSGHKRNGKALRSVGNNHDPHAFSTWGAKALCGIGSLASTLKSRSICLDLRRKLPEERVENLRHADPAETDRLVSQLARFAEDAHNAVKDYLLICI